MLVSMDQKPITKTIIIEASASQKRMKREARHISPNGSPVPFSSTGMPNSSSPTPPIVSSAISFGQQQKISGIPCVAAASKYTAPVHIDVGGTIYTSSLETLTKFPDSRLAKMFNGNIPIVLDSLKQHYFIDRDGDMFRHILNFMRNNIPAHPNTKLLIPSDFPDIDLLLEEARFFDIHEMCRELEQLKKEKEENDGADFLLSSKSKTMSRGSGCSALMTNNNSNNHHHSISIGPSKISSSGRRLGSHHSHNYSGDLTKNILSDSEEQSKSRLSNRGGESGESIKPKSTPVQSSGIEERLNFDCLILNISPDLGERIMLSGERLLIEEVFPETGHAIMDGRSSVAWHHDSKHVIRFPLNGYCKLNSIQAITRLLSLRYRLAASHGGGVDSQQFSEYLFVRKSHESLN